MTGDGGSFLLFWGILGCFFVFFIRGRVAQIGVFWADDVEFTDFHFLFGAPPLPSPGKAGVLLAGTGFWANWLRITGRGRMMRDSLLSWPPNYAPKHDFLSKMWLVCTILLFMNGFQSIFGSISQFAREFWANLSRSRVNFWWQPTFIRTIRGGLTRASCSSWGYVLLRSIELATFGRISVSRKGDSTHFERISSVFVTFWAFFELLRLDSGQR